MDSSDTAATTSKLDPKFERLESCNQFPRRCSDHELIILCSSVPSSMHPAANSNKVPTKEVSLPVAVIHPLVGCC